MSFLNLQLIWGLNLLHFGSFYDSFMTGMWDITKITSTKLPSDLIMYETNNLGTTHPQFKTLQEKCCMISQVSDPCNTSSETSSQLLSIWGLMDGELCTLLSKFGWSMCYMHHANKQHKHPWWDCGVFKNLGFKIELPTNHLQSSQPCTSSD